MAKVPRYAFEYVTSGVSLLQGDGIVVHVVNDSSAKPRTQVLIYHNTGAGAVLSADSGPVDVAPTWMWSLGYTIPQSGEYWLRVLATTEFLIPKASFERVGNVVWMPFVSYQPGDFAIFKLRPTRKRIW